MHPRVFAALGADLITNDIVAVLELVKNSYDAFARNVWVSFGKDEEGTFLEIKDDGIGMTAEIIRNVWFVVASPFKEENSFVERAGRKRRVVGEKGLGRLSTARLGGRLNMITQAANNPCFEIRVDWTGIFESESIDNSAVKIDEIQNLVSPFGESGTRIRIYDLREQWGENRIADLRDNLARLASPFDAFDDFAMFLTEPKQADREEIKIESPEFLSKPKYSLRGDVDDEGNITATYTFLPLDKGQSERQKEIEHSWGKIIGDAAYGEAGSNTNLTGSGATCGVFSFEIRVWDIDQEGRQEIEQRFNFKANQVRKNIRAHKGISIYRDGILVLPKSEAGRDWLGLDLRRVSKVGTRLSTNQLVGYVSITADDNPEIKDTSDRERLASSKAVDEFEAILKSAVGLLENERDLDRSKPNDKKYTTDLFSELSLGNLVVEANLLVTEGGDAEEIIPSITKESEKLESVRKTLEKHFVNYSRLATVGAIAQMLIHEIRSRTTIIGMFLEFVKEKLLSLSDKNLNRKYERAEKAVYALEHLADTFSPLANRNFRRGKRSCVLECQIKECLELAKGISKYKIQYEVPDSNTEVAVDPGELDAILINLIDNAIYWMIDTPKGERKLLFTLNVPDNEMRVRVSVQDSGPGILGDNPEKVFWPGVTSKPNGIGMGLTVASELVGKYGGKMAVETARKNAGATFFFDLPLKGNK